MCITVLADRPQMYLRSKFEDCSPSGQFEMELNATGEYIAHAHKRARACTQRVYSISSTLLLKVAVTNEPFTRTICSIKFGLKMLYTFYYVLLPPYCVEKFHVRERNSIKIWLPFQSLSLYCVYVLVC